MESVFEDYSINEDTVECQFFLTKGGINISYWEDLCSKINNIIRTLSEGYIWHKEEFKVHIPIGVQENDNPAHLKSITCIGDNIEDEWFIVYIILQISKLISELIIQVRDSDGEFLLIEAANCLPTWASPESTDNRVFISNNYIHFIPPSIINNDTRVKLSEAIDAITNAPEQTKAPLEIQQIISKRIGLYPDKIKDSIHQAIVELPLDIATLLQLKPSLISPLVTSYCNHDVIDAKSCKNISYHDCVPVEVKFTKCLYAMLKHSKMIRNSISFHNKETRRDLGLKLTCAYQMIMKRLSTDVFESKEFNIFLNSLKNNGYFKTNIEGSKDYKMLLDDAKNFFLNIDCPLNTQACHDISNIMSTQEFMKSREELKNSHQPLAELTEDDDAWLNINPEQLNDYLQKHYGKQTKFNGGDVISSETITSVLSNFLKQTSDLEGIECDREQQDNDNIDFDSDDFVNSLEKMLKLISTDGKVEDLSDDDDIPDDCSGDEEVNYQNTEMDTEFSEHVNDLQKDNKYVLRNIVQSIKEEEGYSGPSSNLLKSIGFNKTDILDSDDD